MKREYAALKTDLARMIYKNMYRDNYAPTENDTEVVAGHVSAANKRALAIAVKDKINVMGEHGFCIVTFESPISKKDSQLNMKALRLSKSPLTKP